MTVKLTESAPDDDDADVDPRTGDDTDGRVSDRDLQTVVNEIWASGAEAVAVNGQRLTVAERHQVGGEAVLVDFRPLSPPYEVAGHRAPEMRTTFVCGFGGSYLQVLRDYGIDYSVKDSDSLDLPASAGLGVRYVTSPTDVPSGATSDPTEGQNNP